MVLGGRSNRNNTSTNGSSVTAADGSPTPNTTPTQQQQASRPSLLSRISNPLRSRSTRNLVDFHIRPAEPHRKYAAGDHVTGAVILTVLKPIRITHLTVALHGALRVHKTPAAALEPFADAGAAYADDDGGPQFRFLGNGQASLFRDEQVLSAEGPLGVGKYEFEFDLVFPDSGLPSSIDFERGTISYIITSTLTRPAMTSATSHCERRVQLIEQLDVGPLVPPRARTIYIEPKPKKTRRRRQTASTDPATPLRSESVTEVRSSSGEMTGDDAGQNDQMQTQPRSPVQSDHRSERSTDSVVSGSTGFSTRLTDQRQPSTVGSNASRVKPPSDKTITATFEVLKGGCLPGDTIPVKVSVQHIKHIRSLNGVIVTLYRQGRVDSAPPAAMFKNLTKEESRKLERQEYYPRSKTGLSGLSLSSAGTCSMFRKDLSQAFSPLITDPATLDATVTTHVRVPEHVFPTIKGVPGDMISFKYRVEAIVDLAGKLANLIQVGDKATNNVNGNANGGQYDSKTGMTVADGQMINTDALKRQKGVIYDSFEVIIGTSNSQRKGKMKQERHVDDDFAAPQLTHLDTAAENWQDPGVHPEDLRSTEWQPPTPEPYPPPWNGGSHRSIDDNTRPPHAPSYVPPLNLPQAPRGLTEKERAQRAEQVLLPSAPGPPPAEAEPAAPPILSTLTQQSSVAGGPTSAITKLTPEALANVPDSDAEASASHTQATTNAEEPSAPTTNDLTPVPTITATHPLEDKQELEHRRLLAEASAPPEFPPDGSRTPVPPDSASGSHDQAENAPSAPVLTEDDEYELQRSRTITGPVAGGVASHHDNGMHEELPRYER